MSSLLQILAAYVPPAVVRAALGRGGHAVTLSFHVERFEAAILFADISGFTPLTESLAQKGPEGAEELTRLLNRYFGRMIAIIQSEGGEVVQFGGDAVTATFGHEPLDIATRRAQQTARAMQAAMDEFAHMETSAGSVALGMKIGIAAGELLSARVGGVRDRWGYVVAGDAVRQVVRAEHLAQRGQVILSPEAQQVMVPHSVPPRPLPVPDWTQVPDLDAVEVALRQFVPSVVVSWLEEELQEWLSVLRPMTVLFMGVDGIDYEQPGAAERLHTFLRATQERVNRYEGSINKLAVDDKGTVAIVLFGAPPYAHEDDPERAVRCALELQDMAAGQGVGLSIGITTGRVFAGPVGSEVRREYTVMGDTVNLAARLMQKAQGRIYCGYETYHAVRGRVAFEALDSIHVKGKAGLIRIYCPTSQPVGQESARTGGTLVGRRSELVRFVSCLDEVASGQSRILLIEGRAGIGKSRLIEELVRLMRERGIAGLLGMGRSIEQQTPYRAWRDIFTSYFGLDADTVSDPAERRRWVLDHVRDVVPDLVERVPLLNDVLNLGIQETSLTSLLDAQLRHESLCSLLLALLRAWADERPLVLVLEDAHWLDSLSWDLALQVARTLTIARMPLLLVVAMRPMQGVEARTEPQVLAGMPETQLLALDSLSPDETIDLAAARLGVPRSKLPGAVAELVQTRAGGNPFFAEELVYALRDSGVLAVHGEGEAARCAIVGDLAQAAQTLPDTIQGIVLSRIDRLPPEEQLTLKVAAVIGRTFAYVTLHDTLGTHMEFTRRLLRTYLDDLTRLDLTPLEAPEPELTFIFKHIITQEVAYETLLFAQRRRLHRQVAAWYERTYGDGEAQALESPLASHYPLLVYHWHQAGDRARERHYASLAGKWAADQFANIEAAGYLTRALDLTPVSDVDARYDLLLARERVNDLCGEREAQDRDLTELVALAEQSGDDLWRAQVALRQANYAEVTSNYPSALAALQRAIAHAAQAGEQGSEAEGYLTWGNVLVRQGDYDAAREPLERALSMSRHIADQRGEAHSLYRLGHVSLCRGEYRVARDRYQQALELYRAIGDHQGGADSLGLLGIIHDEQGQYSAARGYYEQALSIYRVTGDRRGETMALSNLGVVYCDMGDCMAAQEYHRRALEIRTVIGDRWGEATSLVNLALVYHYQGENRTAREYGERALAIQREIGNRRGEGYSLTYLGHVLLDLGEPAEAAKAYAQAVRLRREMGQEGLAMDDLAGLARVALARGDVDGAAAQVQEILTWVADHGSDEIEYPLQVYLTCYRVLVAAAGKNPDLLARADAILCDAHATLTRQAADIGDETLSRKFLHDVQTHRDLLVAWAARPTQRP